MNFLVQYFNTLTTVACLPISLKCLCMASEILHLSSTLCYPKHLDVWEISIMRNKCYRDKCSNRLNNIQIWVDKEICGFDRKSICLLVKVEFLSCVTNPQFCNVNITIIVFLFSVFANFYLFVAFFVFFLLANVTSLLLFHQNVLVLVHSIPICVIDWIFHHKSQSHIRIMLNQIRFQHNIT